MSPDLGTENVPRLLLKLAAPSVAAQLINMLYTVVDRIYIGHIQGVGTHALTGIGLFLPVSMMINAFAQLAGYGGAPRAAIAMGAGKRDQAEKILGNCVTVLLGIAISLTVLIYIIAPVLLRLFGGSDVTLPYALEYARIYILGTVSVMFVLGINPFITTQGFATLSMITTFIGAVLNIILDPILIFGLQMGVAGAATATVISQTVSALWVLWFLTGKRTIIRITFTSMKLDWKIFGPCLALGISPFVMFGTGSMLNIAYNNRLAFYGGDIAVGAMTIISSCSQFIILPLQGICQGGQPILSYNFGAGNKDRVKRAFRCQFAAGVTLSVSMFFLMMVIPGVFVGIFSEDEQLISYTIWAMRIYMAGIFCVGVQNTCNQAFVALGQARISLLLACLRKLILLIPLICILPLILTDKVFAVFVAEPISDIIAAVITSTLFFVKLNGILEQGAEC